MGAPVVARSLGSVLERPLHPVTSVQKSPRGPRFRIHPGPVAGAGPASRVDDRPETHVLTKRAVTPCSPHEAGIQAGWVAKHQGTPPCFCSAACISQSAAACPRIQCAAGGARDRAVPLPAQSWSLREVGEIPAGQREQVSASDGDGGLRSDWLHACRSYGRATAPSRRKRKRAVRDRGVSSRMDCAGVWTDQTIASFPATQPFAGSLLG
jgi:hypothetical protein